MTNIILLIIMLAILLIGKHGTDNPYQKEVALRLALMVAVINVLVALWT